MNSRNSIRAGCLEWLACVIVGVGLFLAPVLVRAQGPGGLTAIPPGKTGYNVQISNSHWPTNETGRFPLNVTVTIAPKATAGQDLRFRVSLKRKGYGRRLEIIESEELLIPAGSGSGQIAIYPRATNGYYRERADLVIRELGSGELVTDSSLNFLSNDNDYPNMLVVNDQIDAASDNFVCYRGFGVRRYSTGGNVQQVEKTLPAVGALCEMAGANRYGSQYDAKSSFSQVLSNSGWLGACKTSDLPENWIGLTSLDWITMSWQQLRDLAKASKTQRSNLRRWVAAGGRLLVYDLGKSDQADQVLDLLHGKPEVEVRSKPTWKAFASHKKRKSTPTDFGSFSLDAKDKIAAFEKRKGQKFLIRDWQLGKILVVPGTMSDWNVEFWQTANTQLDDSTLALPEADCNQEYLAWGHNEAGFFRIPGIGDPPVLVFQAFLGLFLLVAGPVMLVLLKRTGKMQLIFVIMPVLSLLVCVGLVLYAILVDGFERWGSVQSTTYLDQRSSVGVVATKSAYYSGAQARSYFCSDETLVILDASSVNREYVENFHADEVELAGGGIRSRSLHHVKTLAVE